MRKFYGGIIKKVSDYSNRFKDKVFYKGLRLN